MNQRAQKPLVGLGAANFSTPRQLLQVGEIRAHHFEAEVVALRCTCRKRSQDVALTEKLVMLEPRTNPVAIGAAIGPLNSSVYSTARQIALAHLHPAHQRTAKGDIGLEEQAELITGDHFQSHTAARIRDHGNPRVDKKRLHAHDALRFCAPQLITRLAYVEQEVATHHRVLCVDMQLAREIPDEFQITR